MERLFSPCTRYRAVLESRNHPFENLRELNLNVSIQELISAERAFTYADLYAMLGNEDTIAWLTPDAAVTRQGGSMLQSWVQNRVCRYDFIADGEDIKVVACTPEHLLVICDVVLQLLAASVVHSVTLCKWRPRDGAMINSATLAYLMEQCQSLKVLKLQSLESLDEHHCRVLGTFSRPGLEIEMIRCKLTSAGTSALVEVLGRNQGPTKLDSCRIDYSVLADGLRGNSRLKGLYISRPHDEICNRQVLAIADAVKENKGLVDLMFDCFSWNDETWAAICTSLDTHPTLEVLNFLEMFDHTSITLAVITSRIQALLNMLKVNTSIHTIRLDNRYSQHELFRGSVIPYLVTNRLRPRLLAIQKSRPIAYRAKLLGRALVSVRTDAIGFWMLLIGNADIAFPSRTTTIAAAANLPTPATTTGTSTANDAAVGAFEMPALTTTATDSLPAATATSAATPAIVSAVDVFASSPTVAAATNDAALSAGQKRKVFPQSCKD
jgi:hypothetical protein